jgi:hypothetical protein
VFAVLGFAIWGLITPPSPSASEYNL